MSVPLAVARRYGNKSMAADSVPFAAREEKPLVSCVVTFLNGERFLADAIESIISQTCQDWELILVDDGSTDGSRTIASAYCARHPEKIELLLHPGNLGKSVSRNLGVRASRGEFIALLDADDVWLPEKLQQQVDVLRRHPGAAVTYGPVQYWYSWTGRPQDQSRDLVSLTGFPPDSLVPPPRDPDEITRSRGVAPADHYSISVGNAVPSRDLRPG
jgi:glycosyltransferase involved in cell wall biosynthesis